MFHSHSSQNISSCGFSEMGESKLVEATFMKGLHAAVGCAERKDADFHNQYPLHG